VPWHRREGAPTCFAKRVIACLDVRSNDAGDLVVTKGDQYDVREAGARCATWASRLTWRGAITRRAPTRSPSSTSPRSATFRWPINRCSRCLRRTSENVFVPLTIGGGIRAFTDAEGRAYSALDVASEYFRSGADKISIGSDAVHTVEQVRARGGGDGSSAIEQIAQLYGNQAVVISVDPRRVYVPRPTRPSGT
jgi:glutamine amidotransferase/cyclase